jgi:hypothetical protein
MSLFSLFFGPRLTGAIALAAGPDLVIFGAIFHCTLLRELIGKVMA